MSFLAVTIFITSLLLQNVRAQGPQSRHPKILKEHSFADTNNTFKHEVYLSTQDHSCSASIIGDEYILTAAHCVVKLNSSEFIEVTRTPMIIEAGITNNLNSSEQHHILRLVEKIYVPKGFYRYERPDSMKRDIAVLKLNYKLGLGLNPKISALNIESLDDNVYARESYVVTGFGATEMKREYIPYTGRFDYVIKELSTQLRYAEVNVLHPDTCSKYTQIIPEEQLCAMVARNGGGKAGVCNIDSGGALIDIYSNTIIGVVSFGTKSCDDLKYPTVYTKVKHNIRFIREAMSGILNPHTTEFISFENNSLYNEMLNNHYKRFYEVRLPEWDYLS